MNAAAAKWLRWLAMARLLGVCGCYAQALLGTFQNTNFEKANLRVIKAGESGESAAVTNALPYWTVYAKGTHLESESVLNSVAHNFGFLGYRTTMIIGPEWPNEQEVLNGKYSLWLGILPGWRFDIGQVGQIPATARWLLFNSHSTHLGVTFAGKHVPYTLVAKLDRYSTYGADVSMFAGQEGELRFIASDVNHGGYLDNIRFAESFGPPMLWMAKTDESIKLVWPRWAQEAGYRIETRILFEAEWIDVHEKPLADGAVLTLLLDGTPPARLFRLAKH